MTTLYRVLVTCDEVRSERCAGLVEFTTPFLNRIAGHSDVEAKGWRRGYTADQTWDICPDCRIQVERERAAKSKEKQDA